MNLRSLEYFLAAAEEMNVTRAAERLFISQNHRGILRVGISRLRGSVFFPVIWEFYHNYHPNISVELVSGNSSSLEELLTAGKIDLYIGVDVAENGNRKRIELAREKVHCCFSEKLLREYCPDTWENLLEEFRGGADLLKLMDLPFITVCRGNRLRERIDEFFSGYRMPRYLFECDQQELVYELAEKGSGVGILSPVIFWKNYHKEREEDKPFHVFPVRNEIAENIVALVYRDDYQLPQYAQDFVQDAAMVFQNYSRSISRHFGEAIPDKSPFLS